MYYYYYEDGSKNEFCDVKNCNHKKVFYTERINPKEYLLSKVQDIKDNTTIYIKECTWIAGEGTYGYILSETRDFKKIEKKMIKELEKHSIESYPKKRILKVKPYELFGFNSKEGKVLIPLVKGKVYLIITETEDKEYQFNQVFMNRDTCTSETRFYPNIRHPEKYFE